MISEFFVKCYKGLVFTNVFVLTKKMNKQTQSRGEYTYSCHSLYLKNMYSEFGFAPGGNSWISNTKNLLRVL